MSGPVERWNESGRKLRLWPLRLWPETTKLSSTPGYYACAASNTGERPKMRSVLRAKSNHHSYLPEPTYGDAGLGPHAKYTEVWVCQTATLFISRPWRTEGEPTFQCLWARRRKLNENLQQRFQIDRRLEWVLAEKKRNSQLLFLIKILFAIK